MASKGAFVFLLQLTLAFGAVLPEPSNSSSSILPYSLPGQAGLASSARAAAITVKRATFTYGPGTGGGPYSPNGLLGDEFVTSDSAIVNGELIAQVPIASSDYTKANANQAQYDGLKSLEDYTKLYADGRWNASSSPQGINPGMLTNYTSDLMFSMQRLSFGPYSIRRLGTNEPLPFNLDDQTARSVTGARLRDLLGQGRLFYADYRNFSTFEKTQGKYGANCDALFYISNSTQFLPVAIRANTESSNLIYTPKDSKDDWMLAKLMFNINDFVFHAFHHLANTHYTVEIGYEAAVRTLSDSHPVLAVLARLMYGAFGIRPLAVSVLLRKGGAVDTYTPWTGSAIGNLTADLYFSGYAGAYQSNYFRENLKRRGLIEPKTGPELKNFPFVEDASPIHKAQHDFLNSFVNSYYSCDDAINNDTELQAWVKEAKGPAKVIDFPTLDTRAALVDLLTHFAHLVSTSHHTANLNSVLESQTVFPFNPSAFYKPIPASKGIKDIASWMPPVNQSTGFLQVAANFARPLLAGTNRTLVHMFDDKVMLARMNNHTATANEAFKTAMMTQSAKIKSRKFGANGLSQGMPFLWKALDPNVITWSVTI